ncbi:tRNA (cytidine(34)-2'-O)-methyltransferase [Brevibacterium casei]|uniref:Putative tRNA (cytidine(34)-2'-O)-methyltransferase n=1 Tax=Brevibacterium casei TaxID=33889 RepID=A0A7T4DIP9_9MICO|nr:tRNA (cytidine(34)-2'-O)-methyltransferase [Brevibacterium casei]QQB13626.1 tRNA (cytidine(34)-2'-O)-methyltransferase [Brevibacterium casei]
MSIDIVFHTPEIPGNTGNAIRLAAVTGAHLHLVEPLGFDLTDAKLRRAGLDYHDLAHVTVHPDLDHLWEVLGDRRVIAFTTHTTDSFAEVAYEDGDVLLFGQESTGLPDAVVDDDHVNLRVRIPMLPGRRSLNLANSASIAIYEAWRQRGYAGA